MFILDSRVLWYLRLICFCSFFGRIWRHQHDILKLIDLKANPFYREYCFLNSNLLFIFVISGVCKNECYFQYMRFGYQSRPNLLIIIYFSIVAQYFMLHTYLCTYFSKLLFIFAQTFPERTSTCIKKCEQVRYNLKAFK